MARTRLLKPGFFTNDTLAEVSPIGRLLFAGLWTISDREGRIEDRPKRIKAEVLPFDSANVEKLLADLASLGFIARYESGGQRIIQILSFSRHQSPHPKEPASKLPAMGEPVASHLQDTDKTLSSPAVSIPSPILDPVCDSLAVAVDADHGEAAAAAENEENPNDFDEAIGRLCREWERATGTTVTQMLGDDLADAMGRFPEDWLSDAIRETGLANARTWKYTAAILDRWAIEGREEAPSAPADAFKRSAAMIAAARERMS